jgi:hypothetical protein
MQTDQRGWAPTDVIVTVAGGVECDMATAIFVIWTSSRVRLLIYISFERLSTTILD